ncbi:hypothetical protein SK128_023827 [Halocaridina rubra]|uniref:Uncharacterized protein n=1 Tax=Halocaridina rubra TaxID=373956 RepID=A0AAN8XA18_HALRR
MARHRLLFLYLAVITVTILASIQQVFALERKEAIIAKCFLDSEEKEPTPYCECITKPSRTAQTVNIKCDFNNTEDVILTEDLYTFRDKNLVSAYVRVVNATSVNVTQAFLMELMQSPSIALDIWRATTLYLDAMPVPDNLEKFATYKTFVGVGIVQCLVPEVPKMFLRDRARGALRIKGSRVLNFSEGALHNIKEMRYLVFEDSTIESFNGSVASEGYVTLSQRQLHSWTGLLISNSSIKTMNSDAFNLTHHSDMEVASIINSNIGTLKKEAFSMTGDIDVTIQNNVFGRIESEAFKIAVTGSVTFDSNVIESWETDALEGMICHNKTSMEKNTFHLPVPIDINDNVSGTPFHASCKNPQVFMVVTPIHPVYLTITTVWSWSLGAVLLILVLAVMGGALYAHHRQDLVMHYYMSRGRPLMGFRDRKASQENLPNGAEPPDTSPEVADGEGMTNPIYVEVEQNEEK